MDKKSLYGYKSKSPYRNSPFLDINTPFGEITMEDVPHDILGMTSEGEVQYMKAGSKNPYVFNSNIVREFPMPGGDFERMLKKGGVTKNEKKYMKWKYQQGGLTKDLYSYLFEDDDDEYEQPTSDMPTAPAADEIESQQQQVPEDNSEYEMAMTIALEPSYERRMRRERTTLSNPYIEDTVTNYNVPAADVNSSAKSAFEYYKSKGIPDHVAAGIVGNLMQESGLNPTIKGDKGLATGIAQWHPDRFKNLQSWATASGRNPYSLQTQLDYVLQEANQRGDMAHLLKTKNSAEAAYVFAKKFERPKVIDSKRIAYAKKLN